MPTDGSVDRGLLSPVTVGTADAVGDDAVLGALVAVEIALTRAWAVVGDAPAELAERVSTQLGWSGPGLLALRHGIDLAELATAAVEGGNPVIPLVGRLRSRVPESDRAWVHRGATSQDVLDSAVMLLARGVGHTIVQHLGEVDASLAALAVRHRDDVAVARTLGQHAVPTTVGLRAATWLVGVRRARRRLEHALAHLPAQLGGAAGTLSAFVEHARVAHGAEAEQVVERLVAAFANELDLAVPEHPWHTVRWPVTELGDALVQTIDSLGVIAGDVATLARTEIGELVESAPGGSSAMPHKRNPVASVLIRSAALRAPQLGATLHFAAALAVDERPDGAWHAEWPTVRELLRLALGAAGTASRLTAGLAVDLAAVARNLDQSAGLLVTERLAIVLGPIIGIDRARSIVAAATSVDDLERVLHAEPGLAGHDIAALLDPAAYLGLAGTLVDRATALGEGS